jgi:hypothetical protein
MGANVFANGMEIACKAGAAKVICAFPDVCLSPPSPPAGPIPIPYPITSMDSDTSDGSRTVQIGGEEVMLKSTSNYGKCKGDEAATKSLGMGVVTHSIGGKTSFVAWSSDVKIEGDNADRNLDFTNSNGQSSENQFSWPNTATINLPGGGNCAEILDTAGVVIHPYGKRDCDEDWQSDHILQNACFENSRGGGGISTFPNYKLEGAPCICLEDATDPNTEHGRKTQAQNEATQKWKKAEKQPSYAEVRDENLKAMKKARPALGKNAMDCIKRVVDEHFLGKGAGEKKAATGCRRPRSGKYKPSPPATTGKIKLP